jgi:ribonucleoside-diphosphate reductase alpha chain
MRAQVSPQLSTNATTVLERRYLARDSQGTIIETPQEMFTRVAMNIASAETLYDPNADVDGWADRFYEMMAKLEFLPNSPTLMNAGRELQQLSACFVIDVGDSMESIFEAIKNTALIHKSGGGTGFSFSKLRPKDDRVLSTGGVASGPISFMRVFNAATDAVKQGGTRRGANMAILSVDHPDIIEFISIKKERETLNNFNLSVAITDKFMQAVVADEDYDLINPRTGEVTKRLPARKVFDLLVNMAWDNGEPGVVFIDRMNDDNPTPLLGRIESTNPCGEQPLLAYEACNLGSINLAKMVKQADGKNVVDFERLATTIELAVRFLDNVIDVNKYPLPIIAERTRSNRKIGLGVMGFADMLIQLGIPYDSPAALTLADQLMSFLRDKARATSSALAKERGPFPNFEQSVYAERGEEPLRNATTTTIAPTGTLSIIANCSSGIEPIFAIAYFRNILDNDKLVEVHQGFAAAAQAAGFSSPELINDIALQGSVRGNPAVPDEAQSLFVCAHDVSPDWHVRMQATFQKYTDNAVSKTINLGHEAKKDDVEHAFLLAYDLGCKGITVYRDGSRDGQVLNKGTSQDNSQSNGKVISNGNGTHRTDEAGRIVPRNRPQITYGTTEKTATGCGTLYVTVNADERGVCEVFSQMGKSGGCAQAQSEAVSRLISLALRSGVDIDSIVRQLKGIRCPSIAWREGGVILSCPDAIAKVLEARMVNGKSTEVFAKAKVLEAKPAASAPRNMVGQCPDCSSLLEYLDGCYVCRACGYSRCG